MAEAQAKFEAAVARLQAEKRKEVKVIEREMVARKTELLRKRVFQQRVAIEEKHDAADEAADLLYEEDTRLLKERKEKAKTALYNRHYHTMLLEVPKGEDPER